MAKEIELKLTLPSQAGNSLRQHSVLEQAVSFDSKKLQNIYFDTPDLQLNRHRIALRVRKAGDRFIQTLKTSGSGSGGLHERGEWEWDIKRPQLDLSLISPEIWPAELNTEQLKETLQPAFETNFQRDRWLLQVEYQSLQAEIELVHDQGHVIAGDQKDPIGEVELELKSGDADLLFKIAHDLSDSLPLLVSNISKGQRGFRLFAPEHAGLHSPAVPPFDDSQGLIRAAQQELDHFIAARDQLAFQRDWVQLPALFDSIRQLRWCAYHLSRLPIPDALHLPLALRYKLRMLSYALEQLATLYHQKKAGERLEQCPDELRSSADFIVLNETYQTLITTPWVGQTLLEIMQWLYLLQREMTNTPLPDSETVFQTLLNRISLPRYPTDKMRWLRQQGPLLHLSRWLQYQHPAPSLGLKNLKQETAELRQRLHQLTGLMAEELAIKMLQQESEQTIDAAWLKRNQDDQYETILQLGRHALTFNSLQQNLTR